MNYLPRNRNRHSILKPALFLAGAFVFGLIAFSLLDGVIIKIASPLWRGENAVAEKISKIGNFFRFRSSLISENTALKTKIAALELEIASRFAGPKEGDAIFSMLGRREETGGVVATVLVSPPKTPYDTFVIDAGKRDGAAQDYKVLMPEGPLLGVISEIYESSAKVRLFSAPGESTAAILERHNVPVTLEGAGGGNFRIVVARETEVEPGDRILSADVFSHLLAIVGDISMEPTDSFKEVRAKGPANIFNIHYLVIRP